jgi:transcriptional regulator with XRE-family HTH domain
MVSLKVVFEWNSKREKAAIMLAEGFTIIETAQQIGVSKRTINRWNRNIEFSTEVDRLTLMTGIATKAERLKIAKKVIKQKLDRENLSREDLLSWLKYAQGETDGIKLDLTTLLEAAESMADGG